MRNVEWGFVLDDDFGRAANSRKRLLEHIARSRALALSFHEQFPGVGHVTRNAHGEFDWVALNVGNLQRGGGTKCGSRKGA